MTSHALLKLVPLIFGLGPWERLSAPSQIAILLRVHGRQPRAPGIFEPDFLCSSSSPTTSGWSQSDRCQGSLTLIRYCSSPLGSSVAFRKRRDGRAEPTHMLAASALSCRRAWRGHGLGQQVATTPEEIAGRSTPYKTVDNIALMSACVASLDVIALLCR